MYSRGTRQGVYADLYALNNISDGGYAVGNRRRYGLAGSSAILTTPTFNTVTYLSTPYGGSAAAINSQNMIAATSGTNSTAGQYAHAYLYDYNTGELLDLGTLNDGLTSSAADINESNQVVGTSWLVTQLTSLNDPTMYHAFIWDEANGMVDLNTPNVASSGWILTAAKAINDNGDIVGSGLLGRQVHGFLLTTGQTPPTPMGEPPIAMASAKVTAGKVPLTVNFSSVGSSDPDGSIDKYEWDFGDGSAIAYGANSSHTYNVTGPYIAELTVTDGQDLTAKAQVDITVRKSKGRK